MAKIRKTQITKEEYQHLLQTDRPALIDYLFSKPVPKALNAEAAIIGACLYSAQSGLPIAMRYLKHTDFHDKQYQTLFRAMTTLIKNNDKVDLLTVTDQVRKMGLLGDRLNPPKNLKGIKRTRFISAAISGVEITEPTTRVGSTAHIESHCKIVKEQSMRRMLIDVGVNLIRDSHDLSKDIFNLSANSVRTIRINTPGTILKIETMNEAMTAGSLAPPAKQILGNLVKENEVAIWFSDPGTGKSVCAFQIADAASRGTNVFPETDDPNLKNECEPKDVIVFDFEMENSELFARYSNQDGKKKKFNDRFRRVSINEDFLNYDDADELIMSEITTAINVLKPQLVVIDNITYISSESQDPKVATNVMKRLLAIQKSNPGMTFIVIAHTPKRDISQPLELNNLAGAKNLSNFAKSIVAIGKSCQDKATLRYIKHVKCRNGVLVHDNENVIEAALVKQDSNLRYEFRGHGKESEHLTPRNTAEFHEEMMLYVQEIRNNTKFGWRKISVYIQKKYKIIWSFTKVKRQFEKWQKEQSEDSETAKQEVRSKQKSFF